MAEKYAGPKRESFEKRLARSKELQGNGEIKTIGDRVYRFIGQNEINKQTEEAMKYDEANKYYERKSQIENIKNVGEFSSATGSIYNPKVVKYSK
jgi:hypothetical protein